MPAAGRTHRFGKVISVRAEKDWRSHPKLEEHVVDFDAPESWASLVKGDVAFSSLGTTMKQAGSQAAQKKVDYDYQFAPRPGRCEERCRVVRPRILRGRRIAKSSMFYTRIKGELDRDVQQFWFDVRPADHAPQFAPWRPRENERPGEKIYSVLLGAVNAIGIARKYREIRGDVVAKAMINAALDPAKGTRIFTLDEVLGEAERGQ